MKRRILPALIALMMLLSACAPHAPSPTSTPEPEPDYPSAPTVRQTAQPVLWQNDGRFTLRCRESDTLNPYSCATETNRLLSSLLYEPLIGLSPEFQPESALCTAWITEDGGRSFDLTLREGAAFSDGSEVRGWDVIYSINRAREDSSFYAARLRAVSDVSLSSDGVRITLSSPRPDYPALLDIPVVKEGTAYRDVPVGSGPYLYTEEGGERALVGNPYYPGVESLPYPRIDLADFAADSLVASFTSGSLDLLISEPGVLTQPGLDGAVRRSVPTTVLHYLALNPSVEVFSDPARRRLLNAALKRGNLTGILGGDATLLPLHPILPDYDEDAFQAWMPEDLAAYCIEILTEDYDEDGVLEYFRSGEPTDFAFRLLVCSGNEDGTAAARSIAADLEAVGIRAELRMLGEEDFLRAVYRKDYDAYLASMRLTADFDLTTLFRTAGDDLLVTLASDYNASAGEEKSEAASLLCSYCGESSCLIPLVFERRVIYRRPGEIEEMAPSWTDPFRRIREWQLSKETEDPT